MIPEEDFARQRDFYYSCIYIYICEGARGHWDIFGTRSIYKFNRNDRPFVDFVESITDTTASLDLDQLATLRHLFFEDHTLALADVRNEWNLRPTTRKLPTAERVARQKARQDKLGGLIF